MKIKKKKPGFSLPELLIVFAIIAIILPAFFNLIKNMGVNFSHVYSLLKTETKIIRFKENFRIFCWNSLSSEFRRTGDPLETKIIAGDNVYDNCPDYSALPDELQPEGLDTALTQRDTLFFLKGHTNVPDQWAMLRYDPDAHTLSWYPSAVDGSAPSLVLEGVYRPDYDPVLNTTPANPVIYVALSPSSATLIDCVQVRCKVKISGRDRYIMFVTTNRLNYEN